MKPTDLPEPHFRDPYAALPEAERGKPNPPHVVHQTMVRISGYDRALLTTVHNGRPTLQTTLSILVRHLCYELRKAGITDYDPTTYEQVVGGLRVVLGPTYGTESDARSGSPAPHDEPDRQTPVGDDGRRTPGVARQADGASAKPADVSGARPGSGRRTRSKGTGSTAS